MDIKVLTSTFPSNIQEVIIEILKNQEDPAEIRNSLNKLFKDSWIVVKGQSFSYSVSKANKSAGLFKNLKTKTSFLIFTPPFTDLSTPVPYKLSEKQNKWTVCPIKQSENTKESEKIDQILKILKNVDYDDTSLACNIVKSKVNFIENSYWHIFIGKDFVCALPPDGVSCMVYAKARRLKEELDVVVFRKKGWQRKIDFSGFMKVFIMIMLTFFFFLGIFGYLKCRAGENGFLCENYAPFLYLGLSFIFAKGVRMMISKVNRKKSH